MTQTFPTPSSKFSYGIARPRPTSPTPWIARRLQEIPQSGGRLVPGLMTARREFGIRAAATPPGTRDCPHTSAHLSVEDRPARKSENDLSLGSWTVPSDGASVTIQLTGMFPTRQASAQPWRGSGSEVTGNESSPGPSPAGHGNAPGEGGIWGRAPASPVLIKTPPTPTGAARELGLQLLAPLPRRPDRLARGISHGGAAPDEPDADCRRARILGGTRRLLLCREPSSRGGRSAVTVTRRCRDEARNLEVTGGEGAGEERGAGPGPWGDAAPSCRRPSRVQDGVCERA